MDLKVFIDLIKTIPILKHLFDRIKNYFQKPKIEIFPEKDFQERPGTYSGNQVGPWELGSNANCTAVSITNNGKESIRLDQITLNVYRKKGFFNKPKIMDEIKTDKYNMGFPAKILPGDDVRLTFTTNLSILKKHKIIYQIEAEINNRKIKHTHIREGDAMKPKYSIYALIIIAGVILDQWTKQLILNHIHGSDDFQHWLPVLSIVRTHNMGVSFGMFSAMNLGPWFYGGLSLSIIIFLMYMIVNTQRMIAQLAFTLMISGAIGNVIDRFVHGYVIDFISVHWFEKYYFYVFNVADIFVSCGAGLIILDALIERRTKT